VIPVSVNVIQPVAPGTNIDITGTVDEDWDFIHYTLDVKPGATELRLTLDWIDEINDLDVFLFNPKGDLAATSFWDHPEAISIEHPTPGQWTVAIMAWWLTVPERFTLRVHSPDIIPPTVAITSIAPNPTNISPIPMTATFSEDVTGFELGDITVRNGTAGNLIAVSGREFTFEVTPHADGAVTVDIAARLARDAAGNYNVAAPRFSITYDATAPTVALASTAFDPTNVSPIPMTATFSEDVTGFQLGDITVRNGTAGNLVAVSGKEFTFDVTPRADGVVTVDIAAGLARDAAGNHNTAAPRFSITYNPAAPTVAITSIAPDPTNISPIPMTATFSEDVFGFELGDITVGNGTAGNFVIVSGRGFTFDVTPHADGAVTVDIAARLARDAAGNYNVAAPRFSITYDATAPTVALASTAFDPTNVSPIPMTATFSEDVTGFELGDITVRNGTAANLVAVSGKEFTFEVTPDADGVVTVDIAAGLARDAAGNYNVAAPWLSITYDATTPAVVSISPAADATDVPIDTSISLTFSEEMDKALTEKAFSIEPAVVGILRWVENTMIFEPEIDLEYGTIYTVTILTAAKDLAGNPLAMDYRVSFTILTAPLNWALIGGIIGAVVVIVGLLIYFQVIRKARVRRLLRRWR
jgi:hypothetical protein